MKAKPRDMVVHWTPGGLERVGVLIQTDNGGSGVWEVSFPTVAGDSVIERVQSRDVVAYWTPEPGETEGGEE